MKLPVRSLSAALLLATTLSGCIVIPSPRYHAHPRAVVIEHDRGHHHGHRRGYDQRYDERYNERDYGPYRR